MKYHCRSLLKTALPLLVLVLSALPANATTVIMLTDEELIQTSRVIVTGTVKTVFSAWDDEQSAIYTYVEVRPDRFLKGNLNTKRIVLKQLGGTAGLGGVRISGQPKFVRGQQVLLYLNTAPDGTLRTAHLFMGAFSVGKNAGSADAFVTREIDAAGVETLARPDGQVVTNRAPLNDYLRKIEDTLQHQLARPLSGEVEQTDQPIVAIPPEWARKKQEAAGYSTEFVLLGSGMRWFEPDSGQSVNFYVNPANSPIAGLPSAEINRAMSAWSTQSGANIPIRMAGQTTVCGLVHDNTNTISFGDCLNQLDPATGCAGVLATTSTSWSYETRAIGSQTYNRIVEADVIFNKGMNCFLGVSANLAETTCHELGHAIGLAHSTDPSATMWASAHGGGRDANLGNDDKAGILSLYPSSSGSGGGGGISPISIATFTLPSATVGRFYAQTLSASGGTQPYRWTMINTLPPGLSLSSSGTIQGTPSQTGSYAVVVQVTDGAGSQASKNIVLEVATDTPTISPAITRVKAKKGKKLTIIGQNFSQDSLVILNGTVLTPIWFEKDGNTTTIFVKQAFGPTGTNLLYVQNPGIRSAVFIF